MKEVTYVKQVNPVNQVNQVKQVNWVDQVKQEIKVNQVKYITFWMGETPLLPCFCSPASFCCTMEGEVPD